LGCEARTTAETRVRKSSAAEIGVEFFFDVVDATVVVVAVVLVASGPDDEQLSRLTGSVEKTASAPSTPTARREPSWLNDRQETTRRGGMVAEERSSERAIERASVVVDENLTFFL